VDVVTPEAMSAVVRMSQIAKRCILQVYGGKAGSRRRPARPQRQRRRSDGCFDARLHVRERTRPPAHGSTGDRGGSTRHRE
jgi:hypothetical protein